MGSEALITAAKCQEQGPNWFRQLRAMAYDALIQNHPELYQPTFKIPPVPAPHDLMRQLETIYQLDTRFMSPNALPEQRPWVEAMMTLDSPHAALNNLFWQQGLCLTTKEGQEIDDPISLVTTSTDEPAFGHYLIYLAPHAKLRLLEACSQAKRPPQGWRAPRWTFILSEGSQLELISYQDWHPVDNWASRSFFLHENAQLQWWDAHTGLPQQATQNHFHLSANTDVRIDMAAISEDERTPPCSFATSSMPMIKKTCPPKIHFYTSTMTGPNRDQNSAECIERHPCPAPSAALRRYLHHLGLNPDEQDRLIRQNHLAPIIQALPDEYAVELLNHL